MSFKTAAESIRSKFSGTLELDAPLARCSYYQIGGPADVIATPKTLEDLKLLNQLIVQTGASFFILGWGSNLLFPDEGYRGLIIRMKNLNTEMLELAPGLLKVGASVGCSTLLRRAQEKGWGKLSHLTGIPGSLGGMVAMNAGTHLGEMKDCCTEVEYVTLGDPSFEIKTHPVSPASFSYRHNHFLGTNDLVLNATLKFEPQDPAQVKAEIDALYVRRKQTQPVDYPSCGSVFMNPKESGLHAWQVVDQLGLRGCVMGKAQISEKHSNFIINLGGAKAADVKALIQLVKERASKELGITLREEVKIL